MNRQVIHKSGYSIKADVQNKYTLVTWYNDGESLDIQDRDSKMEEAFTRQG